MILLLLFELVLLAQLTIIIDALFLGVNLADGTPLLIVVVRNAIHSALPRRFISRDGTNRLEIGRTLAQGARFDSPPCAQPLPRNLSRSMLYFSSWFRDHTRTHALTRGAQKRRSCFSMFRRPPQNFDDEFKFSFPFCILGYIYIYTLIYIYVFVYMCVCIHVEALFRAKETKRAHSTPLLVEFTLPRAHSTACDDERSARRRGGVAAREKSYASTTIGHEDCRVGTKRLLLVVDRPTNNGRSLPRLLSPSHARSLAYSLFLSLSSSPPSVSTSLSSSFSLPTVYFTNVPRFLVYFLHLVSFPLERDTRRRRSS